MQPVTFNCLLLNTALQIISLVILQGCNVGRDIVVGIETTVWAGHSGNRIPLGARFSAPVHTGPGATLTSYQVIPGGKATGVYRSSTPIKLRG